MENLRLFVLTVCVQVLYVCGLGNLINFVGVLHLLVHEGAGIFCIGKFS